MTISAHPLTWPEGWQRTPTSARKPGNFGKREKTPGRSWAFLIDLTITEAVSRVLLELERMNIRRADVVISTNVRTRQDGLPRSGEKKPTDPGAAVYWEQRNGARRCIAIDCYRSVEDNLAAIAATLASMRSIERHGGAEILERAFTGFTALPAPGAPRDWWAVLGVKRTASSEEIKAAHRRRRGETHPDKGGSEAEFHAVERAYQEAIHG